MTHRAQLSLFDTAAAHNDDARPTPAQLADLLATLHAGSHIALAGHFVEDHLLGVALFNGTAPPCYFHCNENRLELEQLINALTHECLILTHDAKTLLHGLRTLGIRFQNEVGARSGANKPGFSEKPGLFAPGLQESSIHFADVMIAAHLCNVRTADLSLPNLVTQFLPAEAPRANATTQAAQNIWHLHTALVPRMEALGVTSLFDEVEMPLLSVLFQMESDGVTVDLDYLAALSAELGQQIAKLEKHIFAQVGHSFNVGSPQQLSRVLFDELKLPTDKLHKTWRSGNVSTSAWSLDEIKDLHPIIAQVLQHRELSKLKGTYCDAFPTLVHPHDHLLRTTFQQVSTLTGRLSSTHPNLQNIPIITEMGRRVRQAFVSRWGANGRIISADYSQVELRVLAHLANDASLIAAFERGEDIHARTAATIFQVPLGQVSKEQRDHAKKINFGIAYGMGAKSLAGSTGMSLQAANDFINRYFRSFPALHRWIAQTKRKAHENGYVTTLLGRRRNFPRLLANSGATPERRARAEREAINTVVQGSAADLIKIAMIHLQERLRSEGLESKMVLQVHDELVFDVPVSEIEIVSKIIREEMCQAYTLKAKLDVDLNVGMNWDF